VTPAGYTPKPVFDAAEKLYNVLKTTAVRTDYSTAIDIDPDNEGSEI